MKNVKMLVLLTIVMVAGTCFAQDDEAPTDAQVAADEAMGSTFERATGLPTDTTSWVLKAAEDAGVSDAVTGPLGAFLSASSPSYTADRDIDEYAGAALTPAEQTEGNQFVQQLDAQREAQFQFERQFNQWNQQQLRTMQAPPKVDTIGACSGNCTAR